MISRNTGAHRSVRQPIYSRCASVWVKTVSSDMEECVLLVASAFEQTLLLLMTIWGEISWKKWPEIPAPLSQHHAKGVCTFLPRFQGKQMDVLCPKMMLSHPSIGETGDGKPPQIVSGRSGGMRSAIRRLLVMTAGQGKHRFGVEPSC